ncbi:MAG: F-type H+-transporting ATPase subunit delta [Actinomycetota bacterium]|jgi:F-type H+-transporting ATPase subunit delta|nr:F-type H+-transporting ATPase subunit delta [Actinomycetota bacterium]
MPDESRVDHYAEALFEVAKAEGSLETVEDELFKVARTIEGSDELRGTLADAGIPLERRIGIVHDVFRTAHPTTLALLSFVVSTGRTRDLTAIIDRLVQKAAEERQEAVAEVRTAVALDDELQRRLAEAVGKATGKKVSLKVIVDPSVLGGVAVQVGDTVIDGTVRTRLNQLREAL